MEARDGLAYERIGTGYAATRQPEPAWERAIAEQVLDYADLLDLESLDVGYRLVVHEGRAGQAEPKRSERA